MYVRPSNTGARSIKLPENYSGNAFSNHSPYSDMPPPTRATQPRGDIPFEPHLRQESEHINPEHSIETIEEKRQDGGMEGMSESSTASSIFSSLLPRSDLSRHFPFGHGMGSEELLIIAVMLLVFLSGNEQGEVDSEFLLLLGLLLFAG